MVDSDDETLDAATAASGDKTLSVPISDADAIRRRLLHASRSRLRSKVSDLIRIINKPLADVILEEALPFLPVRPLRRLLAVSSDWNSRLSSPIFAFNHSLAPRSPSGLVTSSCSFIPFDPSTLSIADKDLSFLRSPALRPISSSNGLLLLLRSPSSPPEYLVCNPATAEWTPLPRSPADRGSFPVADSAVLVFNPSALNCGFNYFVVVPFEIGSKSGIFGFDVFSSSSGTWRASGDICYAESLVKASGISAGDVACWRTSMHTVVVFDPTADSATSFPWPLGYSEEVAWEMAAVDGGKLRCVMVADGRVAAAGLAKGEDGYYLWGPRVEHLVWADLEGTWKWVGKEGELGEALMGELTPVRSQSGNLDVVMMTDNEVVELDLAGRRVRNRCDLPMKNGDRESFVVHMNTLASVFSPYATKY